MRYICLVRSISMGGSYRPRMGHKNSLPIQTAATQHNGDESTDDLVLIFLDPEYTGLGQTAAALISLAVSRLSPSPGYALFKPLRPTVRVDRGQCLLHKGEHLS